MTGSQQRRGAARRVGTEQASRPAAALDMQAHACTGRALPQLWRSRCQALPVQVVQHSPMPCHIPQNTLPMSHLVSRHLDVKYRINSFA